MPCRTSLLLLAPLLIPVAAPPGDSGIIPIGMTVIEAHRAMQSGRALRTVPRSIANPQAVAQAFARARVPKPAATSK